MANDNQIQMEFLIEDKSVNTQFAKVEKRADETGKKISSSFSKDGLVGLAAGVFVAEKAFQAFNAVVNVAINTVTKAVALSVEAEAANIKLAAAFSTLNPIARQSEQSFRDFASALQSKIAVDDDFIKSNAAVLVSLGRLSGEGLERATKASFDLAKGIGVGAEGAFLLLAKAANGSTAALSRYGLRVNESLSSSQKFEAILRQIEQRFGGLAAADTQTFGGATKVLNLAFEDLLQTFGSFITQSPSLIAVIKAISQSIVNVTKSLADFGDGEDLLKPFIVGIINFGLAVNEFLIKPLELGFNFLRTGLLTIPVAINGIISLFVKLSDAIAKFIFEPIIKGFGFIADKIIGLFDKDLANRVNQNIRNFGALVGGSLTALNESTTEVFTDSFNALSESAENNFKSRIGASIESYLNGLKSAAEEAKVVQQSLSAATEVETEKIASSWEKAKERIQKAIQDGIVQSISSGLAKIGENLAKGAGAFDNFLNVVLSILGDLAIQVGTILIGIGIGIENLKVALATFNGAALVAAGAALVILGGALKGLAGGAGNSAVGGGAIAGGVGGGGGIGAAPVQESELQQRGAQVQVNISGDVFDTEETGLRIVDILNKSFDQQGVTVRGAV